ncbi:hypothetical protein Hanom_Chr05g00443581 [Helianthus anomalus]
MNDLQITPDTVYQENQALVAHVNKDIDSTTGIIEETVYQALMAQMNHYTPSAAEVCVDNIFCTPAYRKKLSGSKEQADSLVIQLRLSKSDEYKTKKKIHGYKDMVEAQKRDIRKLHNDLSQKRCRHLHFKKLFEQLTVELENLKSTFENTEFNFKKIDVSSEKVEKND